MSLGAVTNDYKGHIWGAAAYGSQEAAGIGSREKAADFKNALNEAEAGTEEEENIKTFGFGAKSGDGSRVGSISAALGATGDMLSQLQFSLLKNNSAAMGNSVSSRVSPLSF